MRINIKTLIISASVASMWAFLSTGYIFIAGFSNKSYLIIENTLGLPFVLSSFVRNIFISVTSFSTSVGYYFFWFILPFFIATLIIYSLLIVSEKITPPGLKRVTPRILLYLFLAVLVIWFAFLFDFV